MPDVTIISNNGGALALVNADGTTNVWSIPRNATIVVTGQRGFGDATQMQTSVNLEDATTAVHEALGFDGAA